MIKCKSNAPAATTSLGLVTSCGRRFDKVSMLAKQTRKMTMLPFTSKAEPRRRRRSASLRLARIDALGLDTAAHFSEEFAHRLHFVTTHPTSHHHASNAAVTPAFADKEHIAVALLDGVWS